MLATVLKLLAPLAGILIPALQKVRIHHVLPLFQLAAVVLVCYGVSEWSVPSALILGGLTVIVALEVKAHDTVPVKGSGSGESGTA